MSPIAKNNAFGADSPSWNLDFPDGNLTAAEILAYLPHWLKSVDVILRLVNHGGRSVIMTFLLDKYRVLPSGDYKPNSTTVMMHYAMRRAGKKEWTIGTRDEYENDREYDENSLYVGDFRPPRLTHPKGTSAKQRAKQGELVRNFAADPIPFKDLAIYVKEHPSGEDALDLTRCVKYALNHLDEKWLFPTDFGKLVKHVGGPLPVTHSHLDKQLFDRYNTLFLAHAATRAPAKYNKKPKAPLRTRAIIMADDSHNGDGGRRSNRRLKKAPVYVEKDENVSDVDDTDYTTPPKRKLARIAPMPKDVESDFEAKEEPDSDDDMLPVINQLADNSHLGTPTDARGKRLASHNARQSIQDQSSAALMEQFRFLAATAKPAHKTFKDHNNDPAIMEAARAYAARTPIFFMPPVLSANRLVIDAHTVYIYAQEGCRNEDELWASALSTYRFEGGPRLHAPFRELYRLTEPMAWDTSDWAENIRWAKEQYNVFGVDTWTEYIDHLDRIMWRRYETMWVSEQTILAGM